MNLYIELFKLIASFAIWTRACSYLEWNMHQHPMHTKLEFCWQWLENWVRQFFINHAELHHGDYKPGKSFFHPGEVYGWLATSKILLLTPIPIPLYLLFGWFLGWGVFWGTFLAGTVYVCGYEYLHYRIHTPFEEKPKGFLAIFLPFYIDAIRRHHQHHKKFNDDMNVFLPLEDMRRRTLVIPARLQKPEPHTPDWLQPYLDPSCANS